ncbi:hypothetical protein SERLA73DRAFT_182177 [Serpula lacrymans var. lacrymans S7.3]|uniref:Uncharacterized protein n=2 Tax=Serpula lacrymans var. lacrymans TaxID=341189 RepID=F8PWT5_SERL3|nr:uncharacterized protein SERLADRAFT_468701 [Serpula lacrymans var. lacrymans S7.9]EGN99262.1 hypothetical protein SERLA73DRAFT_182177 [Serpula lacrymans var. lacrymans S7.3]EGO24826.1 hypothetical protein SERLADRAFT_468701 [Serpula lacrymans var. lacrymans S7.9]
MSPRTGKPVGSIKVKVPRHNAHRIGEKLNVHIKNVAKSQGNRVDIYQPNFEGSSNALALAIESASEWNSLLQTARAERGPQWDVGTQQFLVDVGSDLYYDPSPLLEYQKQQRAEEEAAAAASGRGSMQPPEYLPGAHDNHPSPRMMRSHSSNYQQYGHGAPMSPNVAHASPRHPGQMGGFSGAFNAIPPSQFYGPGETASPARMGLNREGMSMSPDIRRRVTRGMVEDGYMGLHGP